MPALDIFSSSAFTMVALTDAINKIPYVSGRIGQLGLFWEQGVATTSSLFGLERSSLFPFLRLLDATRNAMARKFPLATCS